MKVSRVITKEYQVNTDSGAIYAKKWFPEKLVSTTPIVLMHDSLGCVELWRDFPQRLCQTLSRCVIVYDRLGFGKSHSRVKLPSVDFISEEADVFIAEIKNQLSIDHYILLGHSVGGAMAINIAAKDSDCLAVVTLSTQAFIEGITISGIKAAQAFFQKDNQMMRLQKWHGAKANWVLAAWVDTWLSTEFANWSLSNCIQDVLCPVLAIHGDKDEYGSIAFPKFITEKVSGASESLILNNCGHMPHKEKTTDVLNSVSAFLKSNRL